MAQFNYINTAGEQVAAEISVVDYKAAAAQNMSLSQYLEQKYGADADTKQYGSVFRQACHSQGIYKPDHKLGLTSPTVGTVLGEVNLAAGGSIGSPDGSDSTPAGRILYPEVVMSMIRETLESDESDVLGVFDQMIALKENITSDLWVQPQVNTTANEDVRSQPTSQLALPPAMVEITTSQYARAIQTKSIGLMISEQALNHASLDLVALAVSAQSRGERIAMLYEGITGLLNGDVDAGTGALTQKKAQDFDSAITAAGEMTHKSFLFQLHSNRKRLNVDSMICDLETYLAYESRSGRPVRTDDRGEDGRADINMNRLNFKLSDMGILLVDTDVLGANTALQFDKRYAIRKVTNLSASYSAVEQFVLRRAQGLRLDYGEHVTRLYDEAFQAVSLTV